MKNYLKILATVVVIFTSCKSDTKEAVEVNQTTIGKHIERLASDDFMGRKPFTKGEVITVNYLKDEFEKLGLLPGNGDNPLCILNNADFNIINISVKYEFIDILNCS